MAAFGDYQNEIYFKGLHGVKPKLPVNFKLLEQKARAAMPESVLSYVAGGCGDEHTQELNVAAFEKWGLVPRMMVDCSKRDSERRPLRLTPLLTAPHGPYRRARHLRPGRTRRSRDRQGRGHHRRSHDRLDAVERSARSGRQGRSAAALASSSSIRQPTANSPKAWCVAPSRPGSRRSW